MKYSNNMKMVITNRTDKMISMPEGMICFDAEVTHQ